MIEKRLKILFLTARFPYPIIGGDRLKPNYVLTHLAENHDVTLVSFYHGGKAPKEYVEAIESKGIKVRAVPLNPIVAAFRTVKNAYKYPLEIGFYTQPEYKKVVDKLLEEENFDLAFSFFMRTAEYVKNKPIKKILMAEDCRTLYQKRSFQNSRRPLQKLVRFWEYKALKRYEPEIVNHFDAVTLVTPEDIEAMEKQNPNARYALLSNGVDISKFNPPKDGQIRKDIIFAGKMDVWANQLMATKLVKEILPRIKNKIPNVKLKIVGANPPNTLRAFESKNVEIIPDVPDMIPYLQEAKLFLHPHNGGSGIQNKLLEAMACGCPVATTPTGNQGIHAKHGEEALIGETAEDLADLAIEALKNNELNANLSQNGRKLIEKTHSWEVIFKSTDEIIEQVTTGKTN